MTTPNTPMSWNDDLKKELLNCVRIQLSNGQATDTGIKKAAWTDATAQFNRQVYGEANQGQYALKSQLQNQYSMVCND